jgi:excisionase family DNA binding protein
MVASAEPLHPYQPGLTVGQVASRLKVSPSTARRWVRSGRLPSTRVRVGDGFEYRVPLEAVEGLEGAMNASEEPPVEASSNPSMNGSAATVLEASVERSTAVAAYNAQLLAPLVAVIERQAEQLVRQAETIGRQSAELDAARAQISTLEARTAPQAAEPSPGAITGPLAAAVAALGVLDGRGVRDRPGRDAGGALVSLDVREIVWLTVAAIAGAGRALWMWRRDGPCDPDPPR